MNKVLVIEGSPRGVSSISRKVAAELLEQLKKTDPKIEVIHRDLSSDPVPHLSAETVTAFFTPPEQRSPELAKAIALSDQLVDELLGVDTLIISTPMWNFGVPSVVKAWIDHVSRAGRTFSFGPTGLKGLVTGKKVYIVLASGSVFSDGPFQAMDFVAPYLRSVLGFLGMTDVSIIRAEGLNDPKTLDTALEKTRQSLKKLL